MVSAVSVGAVILNIGHTKPWNHDGHSGLKQMMFVKRVHGYVRASFTSAGCVRAAWICARRKLSETASEGEITAEPVERSIDARACDPSAADLSTHRRRLSTSVHFGNSPNKEDARHSGQRGRAKIPDPSLPLHGKCHLLHECEQNDNTQIPWRRKTVVQ